MPQMHDTSLTCLCTIARLSNFQPLQLLRVIVPLENAVRDYFHIQFGIMTNTLEIEGSDIL